jgi:putative transposase
VVERFGIPAACTIDNTLAAANKTMSGGLKHRFRFKVRPEEMLGVFPLLGVEVHWAKPNSGQSKPIERGFGDFARDVSRHPAFEGAYTGNRPENKPWNHGEKAVPIAEFERVLATCIAEHNARPGRTAANCRGRSFDETFAVSFASAPIARATEAQRRLFLLAAEEVKVRGDGTLHLLGNRYHDPALIELVGTAVTLRFDPDDLHRPAHIYRADGSFVCVAECIADVGFGDSEAAREHARSVKQRRKGIKLQAEAERRIDAAQIARDLAALPPPETDALSPRVIRPLFGRGNTAAALAPVYRNREEEDERLIAAVERANAARGGRHLSLVPEEDEAEGA